MIMSTLIRNYPKGTNSKYYIMLMCILPPCSGCSGDTFGLDCVEGDSQDRLSIISGNVITTCINVLGAFKGEL